MYITRDDIDEAGSIVRECDRKEQELVCLMNIQNQPACVQEAQCPELTELRKKRQAAARFLYKHN